MLIKFCALADISLELFMFLYEVYRLRNLSKQSVDVVVRFSEEKRRAVYASRYFKLSSISYSVAVVAILVLSFTLPQK